MKTKKELYDEHFERLSKTINLEKVDRTPYVHAADSFCANHMGVKMSEFCVDAQYSNEIMVKSALELGEFDGVEGTYVYVPMMSAGFLSRIKLPGKELPEGFVWQVDEQGLMTEADYDTIINGGWNKFKMDFLTDRIQVDMDKVFQQIEYEPVANQNFEKGGYVVYYGGFTTNATDYLCGGRSITKFMMDLRRMPDKVEAVLEIIVNDEIEALKQQLSYGPPLTVWVSTARGNSDFYSPKLWERFVWKPMKKLVDAIIAEGSVANLHMDGMWERDLDYFRSFPKGKCVFELDSITDIYKVKEKLGDTMCIKGDVSSAMLTLGTPDQVYKYSKKLIADMGSGFILSSGCTIPPNAKLENIKAMISAAMGK